MVTISPCGWINRAAVSFCQRRLSAGSCRSSVEVRALSANLIMLLPHLPGGREAIARCGPAQRPRSASSLATLRQPSQPAADALNPTMNQPSPYSEDRGQAVYWVSCDSSIAETERRFLRRNEWGFSNARFGQRPDQAPCALLRSPSRRLRLRTPDDLAASSWPPRPRPRADR